MGINRDDDYMGDILKEGGTFHGITIEVDGEVLGKIKEWKPTEAEKLEAVDYKPVLTRQKKVVLDSIFNKEIPVGLSELWMKHCGPEVSGKSTLYRTFENPTHPEADIILAAQLEMWNFAVGDVIPPECSEKLLYLLFDLGYQVWVSSEASPDKKTLEDNGVVVENFEFHYVSRGEEKDK